MPISQPIFFLAKAHSDGLAVQWRVAAAAGVVHASSGVWSLVVVVAHGIVDVV